nr:reverse transcriptase domain-containing protein [Tanacetum cinerariifolium]
AKREEIPEVDLPLRKRLCTAHSGTYELGESSTAAAARLEEPVRDDLYRFVDTVERREGSRPATMVVSYGITDTWDDLTSMIYAMIEEKQDDQALQRARVNKLFRDRRYHARTARLMEGEARASRTAWAQLMDASDAARSGVIALRTQVLAQQTEITDMRAADCRIQTTATRVPTQPEGIAKALAARDADRNTNGDDSHVSGTEGVVELTHWFKKIENVFRLSNCSVENQIKFSTCTLLGSALMWWNSHVITVGPDVAYAMTWVDLKKTMTDKYCPRGEMKKLECELWNLRVKSNDVNKRQNTGRAYTARSGEKKPYGGSNPLCPNCNYHHDGPCALKCHKCKKVGHFACDYRSTANVNTANNQRGNGTGGNATAPAKVYAVGHAGTNPDSNVVTEFTRVKKEKFKIRVCLELGFLRS